MKKIRVREMSGSRLQSAVDDQAILFAYIGVRLK